MRFGIFMFWCFFVANLFAGVCFADGWGDAYKRVVVTKAPKCLICGASCQCGECGCNVTGHPTPPAPPLETTVTYSWPSPPTSYVLPTYVAGPYYSRSPVYSYAPAGGWYQGNYFAPMPTSSVGVGFNGPRGAGFFAGYQSGGSCTGGSCSSGR